MSDRSRGHLGAVPGLSVGHWTDATAATGCTVVLAAQGATCGVDVRGSAPGTRETDLLRPGALVERVHAVLLAGGSAFGLAAADGVMRRLEERGIGFATPAGPVPIVPAAILYDLEIGAADVRPGADAGYAATVDAERGAPSDEGCVGAGTGATVAKRHGPGGAWKGGLGTAARDLPDGTTLGALAVVNAVGDVVDLEGRPVAMARPAADAPTAGGNTTLAVIGTDAALDRAQCRKLAELGHDAIARVVRPAHTIYDGDVVFALATGSGAPLDPAAFTALATAGEALLAEAIVRGVRRARSLGGVPAVGASSA